MSEEFDLDCLVNRDGDINMVTAETPATADTTDLSTTTDIQRSENDAAFSYYNAASPLLPSLIGDSSHSPTVFRDVKDPNGEPGLVGLRNLGNTCFMNSGIQCLLSNVRIVEYFLHELSLDTSKDLTITGRFSRLLKKCWSGHFSLLHPSELKETVGLYYPQFQDYRQHDCQEFLALLLDSLHEQLNLSQLEAAKCQASITSCMSMNSEESSSNDSDVCLRMDSAQSSNITSNDMFIGTIEQPSTSGEIVGRGSVSAPSVELKCVNVINSQHKATASYSDSVILASKQSNMIISHHMESSSDEMMLLDDDEVDKRKLPSVEDICMKDTKTLNTNVLAAEFLEGDELMSVATDSSKFHKQDNSLDEVQARARQMSGGDVNDELVAMMKNNQCDDIFLSAESKMRNAISVCKPCKETNLLANMHEKFSDADSILYKKKYFLEHLSEKPGSLTRGLSELEGVRDHFEEKDGTADDISIGKIKRIKIDNEKNECRETAQLLEGYSKVVDVEPPSPPQCTAAACKVNNEIPAALDVACSMSCTEDKLCDGGTLNDNCLTPSGSTVQGACSSQGVCSAQDACRPVLNNEEENRETWRRYTSAAEKAWMKYMSTNESVIVSTFQGQFKSTVVCAECQHVSVTFEPFMYLSVPLPHAMERQIYVTYMSCENKPPIRYLLTVNKQSPVRSLKQELLKQVGDESCEEIVIAEVLNHHISRILEDGMQIKAINDRDRVIYGFEMLTPPPLDETLTPQSSDNPEPTYRSLSPVLPNNVSSTLSSAAAASGPIDEQHIQPSAAATAASAAEGEGASDGITKPAETVSEPAGAAAASSSDVFEDVVSDVFDDTPMLNNQCCSAAASGEVTEGQCSSLTSDICSRSSGYGADTRLNRNSDIIYQHNEFNEDVGGGSSGGGVNKFEESLACSGEDNVVEDYTKEEVASGAGDVGIVATDGWKSCAICLEEMDDCQLLAHCSCSCTLCTECLDKSVKHSGVKDYACPVCSAVVKDVSAEFIHVNCMDSYKPKTRILHVPVIYRCILSSDKSTRLFGHPNIIYLPSNVSGETVYQSVDRFVPCYAQYTIVLTDGQGLHCSRCLYVDHCSGCEVLREEMVNLQPSDHLAVIFTDLSEAQMDQAAQYVDDKSVQSLRCAEPLTLYDCFKAFTESEVLDEHNPWYCPCCKRNQCANKTMTVWRYPDTLIVYLKRFVYHELSSTKIDSEVIFPVENLDLSEYISGPRSSDLIYDLQSCVCHFGGANSGHYTAYARHIINNSWYYFNDETFVKQTPRDSDRSSAYVLFYQRRGEKKNLDLPRELSFDDEPASPEASPIHSSDLVQYGPAVYDPADALGLCEEKEEDRSAYPFYS